MTAPPPIPEEVKALADMLDRGGQFNFLLLCLADNDCHIGNLVKAIGLHAFVRLDHLEDLAGIALGDIDPEGLLNKKESLKKAGKRLGLNTNATKQARHRAKERMAKLKSTMPIVSIESGHIVEVTEQA
jgi:hypothetical protein